jgi:hypothetical protein
MWQLFRDSSLALVESTLQLLERRVALVGKKGFKDIFFLAMILSYVKAKESPELAERYMKQAADRCARVFQSCPSLNDLFNVRLSPFNSGHELKSQHPVSSPDGRTEPVVDFVLPVWISLSVSVPEGGADTGIDRNSTARTLRMRIMISG